MIAPSEVGAKPLSDPFIIEAAMQVNLEDSEKDLATLVDQAMMGEDIIIAKAGRPVVKLSKVPQPHRSSKKRIFGSMEGKVKFLDPDWDKPMTEEEVENFFGR